LILIYVEDGSDGVRELLKRAGDYRRIKSRWYVPVFCLWPAAMFLEYWLMYLTGAPLPDTQLPILMVPIFIVREQGDSDKREVYVTLTERGAELLEQLTAVHQEELQHIAPQLGAILEGIRVNYSS
jgi:hypothetical protein